MSRTALLGGLLLLASCRGHGPGQEAREALTFEGVRPTLEEIFREPPIRGDAPRIERLSPDGRFLLFYWSDLPPEELEGNYKDLRLLDVEHPEATNYRGTPLPELLPKLGTPSDDKKLGPVEWSHHGHRLAIGRGVDLILFDPLTLEGAPLILGKKKPEDDGDPEVDGRAFEKRIQSLAFSPDDRFLRFSDGQELYDLPAPAGLPTAPVPLEQARWWSEPLEARALSLRWSHDLSVVFGLDPAPMQAPKEVSQETNEDTAADDPAQEEEAQEEPPVTHHVWRLDENRGVALAGIGDPKSLERAAISPGGRFVFAARYDRSSEPDSTLVPDYLTERVTTRKGRRQLADAVPSPVELLMWKTSTGAPVPVLPRGGPVTTLREPAEGEDPPQGADYWVRTLGWAPQPERNSPARFAFELWSADYRELTLWVWTEGYAVPVWTERDERWVGGEARYVRWTPDGSRLVLGSECTDRTTTPGRGQLFSVDPDTGESVQLTAVAGVVRGFEVLQDGGVLFRASREDPARISLGSLTPDMVAGGFRPEVRWLDTPQGWAARFASSRDGQRIVYTHERLFEPPELRALLEGDDRELTRTRPDEFEQVDWIHPRRITLESSDGRQVRAHVFLPHGVELEGYGGPRRASVVFVHGAGYLQNVTDSMTRYPMNLLFHSRLAQMGYPVIDVDYRGSAGYGRDFRTDVQYHLGGKDLDDIHLVVDELVDRGIVDPGRVGIYGGSYGGFLTLMALFTSHERWTVGAALRSVTDWRTYHPSYTQPRLGRPSTHPEAYEKSSPIDHVDNLEDPLLVLHGMLDSNVFAQDSVRLIEELIDRGLEFDAMLYPSQGHGFSDAAHWLDQYRRIERYLLRHLGPAVVAP